VWQAKQQKSQHSPASCQAYSTAFTHYLLILSSSDAATITTRNPGTHGILASALPGRGAEVLKESDSFIGAFPNGITRLLCRQQPLMGAATVKLAGTVVAAVATRVLGQADSERKAFARVAGIVEGRVARLVAGLGEGQLATAVKLARCVQLANFVRRRSCAAESASGIG